MANSHICIERDLLNSKAWFKLSAPAIQILMIFMQMRQFEKFKYQGRTQFRIKNERELILPYSVAKQKYGFTHPRFHRAIKQLVEVGFIDIVKPGDSFKRQPTVYGLSNRWRKYGIPDFEKVTIEKRKTKAGFDINPHNRKRQVRNRTNISNANITGEI